MTGGKSDYQTSVNNAIISLLGIYIVLAAKARRSGWASSAPKRSLGGNVVVPLGPASILT